MRSSVTPACLGCLVMLAATVGPSRLVEAEKLIDSHPVTTIPDRAVGGDQKVEKSSTAPDPVYDRFLQRFIRAHAKQRQYLEREIKRAATKNDVDPDLLFALIAVESRFDPKAVSPEGARGLGQVLFSTGKAVAPKIVRRPKDLHSVRHNLTVTARYLKQLLDEWDGDIRAALLAYRDGPAGPQEHGPDRYVKRIQTYIASLKEERGDMPS